MTHTDIESIAKAVAIEASIKFRNRVDPEDLVNRYWNKHQENWLENSRHYIRKAMVFGAYDTIRFDTEWDIRKCKGRSAPLYDKYTYVSDNSTAFVDFKIAVEGSLKGEYLELWHFKQYGMSNKEVAKVWNVSLMTVSRKMKEMRLIIEKVILY
jgi:hypothetical protein